MSKVSQLPLAVQLPDDETFASYVGDTNRRAAQQLQQFVEQSASELNGFYLFGGIGVGKSHLLHAVCAQAQDLALTSVCLSFAEIIELPVSLFDGLEQIDCVCLDDIQLIAGNDRWQTAVFDLFNRLSEQGHRIVISGDQAVQQLGITLPDLESRLSWGLVEQVKTLSDDEKIAAFLYRARQRGLVISDDVVKYLFHRVSRDMSHLLRCLDLLDKASIQSQRKITIPFIKSVLSDNLL